MAPWGDAKLFFCLFFITCCCTATFGQMAIDCCLKVKNDKRIGKSFVEDYHQQFQGQGCSIDAMVLVTRGGRKLCVPAHQPWVKAVVNHVNNLRKLCKENPQIRRCKRVMHE